MMVIGTVITTSGVAELLLVIAGTMEGTAAILVGKALTAAREK